MNIKHSWAVIDESFRGKTLQKKTTNVTNNGIFLRFVCRLLSNWCHRAVKALVPVEIDVIIMIMYTPTADFIHTSCPQFTKYHCVVLT